MEFLSSRQNRIISHVRRIGTDAGYRRECREYVCDGVKLLGEAIKWGAAIKTVLWCCEPTIRLPERVKQYSAPQELLDYASPLKNCPGVMFTVEMKSCEPEPPGKTLVLESVQDPGNVGTIIRTANALNMDTVILTGECADVYNPKTVRAAMGALFRQRIYLMERDAVRTFLTDHSHRLYGAALTEGAVDIRSLALDNVAVAIGSEGRGLSQKMLSMCDGELIIPMNSACESLNAGVAAAIIMWELMRG